MVLITLPVSAQTTALADATLAFSSSRNIKVLNGMRQSTFTGRRTLLAVGARAASRTNA